jgi:hypothetical protein
MLFPLNDPSAQIHYLPLATCNLPLIMPVKIFLDDSTAHKKKPMQNRIGFFYAQ